MTSKNSTSRKREGAAARDPYFVVEGDLSHGLLLLCDHASSYLPEEYGTLGLDEDQFKRHIAYDIGAKALTLGLAAKLGVPAVLTCFSRLLIDPNRGLDDPTLIMKLSDGAVIRGNHPLDERERVRRIEYYHQPYHRAISRLIDRFLDAGHVPMVFSIHSFTDKWKGNPRPWHASILWDNDERLPVFLLRELRKQQDIIVGDNEPYDGALGNDTMYTHCTRRGLANALLEVRQDLISNEEGVEEWVRRIAVAIKPAIAQPQMHEILQKGSRSGPVAYIEPAVDLHK